MTALPCPCPFCSQRQIEIDTLCNILDVIASHQPDGPYRCEIETAAASHRAAALVIADREARANAERIFA